jgi:hypothetical protein
MDPEALLKELVELVRDDHQGGVVPDGFTSGRKHPGPMRYCESRACRWVASHKEELRGK